MTRRLLLIRHAEAAFSGDGTDHGRELAPFGLAQAQRLGRLMAAGALPTPQVVYRSDATRAMQTWDAVATAAGCSPTTYDLAELYSAATSTLSDTVRGTDPDVEVVAVVGHAPEVPALARALADDVVVRGWPPATVGVVEVTGPWSQFPEDAVLLAAMEIDG